MPPKTTNTPRKQAPVGRSRKLDKSKNKEKRKRRKLNLKGWLKTPVDWARFDAWAKINAQPRKIPEPEAIVRPSKPLSQLRRRIQILSQPREAHDPSINCHLDLSISKAALKAIATKRIIRLSWPIIRLPDFGRDFSKISPAALRYEATQRIIDLSQPRIVIPEECKSFEVSKSAMRHKTTERERRMALAKKLVECPEGLTVEEMEELFTPGGVRKSALLYRFTSWMVLLSLPPYKSLKDRKDPDAKIWKKMILEEGEERGKKALAEQRKKRGQKRKHADRKEAAGDKKETKGEEGEETVKEEQAETANEEKTKDEERKAKRRKIEKNAWRFEPPPCKDDPYLIARGALTGKVSPRVDELAEPRIYKNKTCKNDPFGVKKGALTASPSGRVEELAKPTRPRSPVEREPPREKDQYGMPIFEKPAYGKVLPKTKPYKMGDCPPAEKKKMKKRRPIDPIVYQPTIDPCISPRMARIQKRERKRAAKVLQKQAAKRKRQKKKPPKEKKTAPLKTETGPKDAERTTAEEQGIKDERQEDRVGEPEEATDTEAPQQETEE